MKASANCRRSRSLGLCPRWRLRSGDLSSLGKTVYNPYTGQPFTGNVYSPFADLAPMRRMCWPCIPFPTCPAPVEIISGPRSDRITRTRQRPHRSPPLRYSRAHAPLCLRPAEPVRTLLPRTRRQLPGFGDYVYDRGHNALIHEQQTFGATATIPSFSVSIGPSGRSWCRINQTNVDSLWGVNFLPTVPRDYGFPGISVTGYSRVGDVAALPINRADNTYQLVDNFSLVRGAHSLKMGGELRDLQLNGYVEVLQPRPDQFHRRSVRVGNRRSASRFADVGGFSRSTPVRKPCGASRGAAISRMTGR